MARKFYEWLQSSQFRIASQGRQKILQGKKVPDHWCGPSLLGHFLRFRPFDGDKGKPMSDFTVALQRLHQLSLNHDTWLATKPKTHRQCLQFLIFPSIILAARFAYGGYRMKRWTKQQWNLVKWMIRDQSTWPERMPSFWKDSHFEYTPWIETTPDIGKERPEDWDAFEITPPDYPCDWAAYIWDTPSGIQAELALALVAASESTVEGAESSVQVPCHDNKDDTNTDLKEGEEDDAVQTNPNPPAHSQEEAIKYDKWKEITHRLVQPELLSGADTAALFYTTLRSLVDISAKSKVKAQTRSDELVKKEETINRLLRKLQAEKEELQQEVHRSRQKHEDCDMMIGKIKEEIVKRDCAKWPGKRQRLDENDDGAQDAGSGRKRECRDDNSDGVQDGGSHRERQRLSLDDEGDCYQNAGSRR
ncbi:hypothetical protein QBC37DRAFT_403614 [Rhypophila decipiens]|uniref:Uncharacterized protein n=1 Tax=Rhypophila decipiens TaxID=261697 RepID=A0AAN6Y2U0_9PEZI|nr:hypothetical protein QBC37DRAFT_403614 [Rhypophila decipiens]